MSVFVLTVHQRLIMKKSDDKEYKSKTNKFTQIKKEETFKKKHKRCIKKKQNLTYKPV